MAYGSAPSRSISCVSFFLPLLFFSFGFGDDDDSIFICGFQATRRFVDFIIFIQVTSPWAGPILNSLPWSFFFSRSSGCKSPSPNPLLFFPKRNQGYRGFQASSESDTVLRPRLNSEKSNCISIRGKLHVSAE
jgi:hypothetical protein